MYSVFFKYSVVIAVAFALFGAFAVLTRGGRAFDSHSCFDHEARIAQIRALMDKGRSGTEAPGGYIVLDGKMFPEDDYYEAQGFRVLGSHSHPAHLLGCR